MVKEVIRVNTIVSCRLKDAYPYTGLESKINEHIHTEFELDKEHEYDIKNIEIKESKTGDWVGVIVYSVKPSSVGAYTKTGVRFDDNGGMNNEH